MTRPDDLKAMEELLASIRQAIHEHTARQAAGLEVSATDADAAPGGEGVALGGPIDDLEDDIVFVEPATSAREMMAGARVGMSSGEEGSATAPVVEMDNGADPVLEEPAATPPLDALFLARMMGGASHDARGGERADSPATDARIRRSGTERKRRDGAPGNVHNELLERQVRGVLEPMLQRWMDERLPPLVERLVREELRRMLDPDRPRLRATG